MNKKKGKRKREIEREIVREKDIERDNTVYQELFVGTPSVTNRNRKKGKRKREIEKERKTLREITLFTGNYL